MFNSLWYKNLIKPPFAPPDWVFAPAWTILYTTIFIALILYIRKPAENKKQGYVYFAIQLVLNFAWSPVFFGMKNMALGLVVILLMVIFTFLTVKNFFRVSKIAGILLVPYLLWIIFATYLNIGYLVLN